MAENCRGSSKLSLMAAGIVVFILVAWFSRLEEAVSPGYKFLGETAWAMLTVLRLYILAAWLANP
jgi:hypothetical protein